MGTGLAEDKIAAIARQVYRRFPEMRAVRPTVRLQVRPGSSSAKSLSEVPHFVLTFKGKAPPPGKPAINCVVRVVADSAGHILKISSTR